MPKILFAGESWVTSETHYKGFDAFGSVHHHLGAEDFLKAVKPEFEVDYMQAHEAVERLPFTLEGLQAYDAVVLSDIGSNSLLLHPDVWLRGRPTPNRLKLLRSYVEAGGGLMMIGGYLTFQGIDGKARWRGTPVEDVLPVTCLPYDDRIEVPEGFSAVLNTTDHEIMKGLEGEWPKLLGANEVVAKDSATVLASLPEEDGGHPLLVAGTYGKGRTLAYTSDVGPHWAPSEFLVWKEYGTLWLNCLRYLTAAS